MNKEIAEVAYWIYQYVPLKTNENGVNYLHWIKKKLLYDENYIDNLLEKHNEQTQIGIFDRVLLESGEYKHIPMMDFDIEKSPSNLELLVARLKNSEIKEGWIVESGASYHYFGSSLLTETEWVDFIGRCLLTSVVHNRQNIQQIADPRFIGHSLRRGGCNLRITTRADKTFVPRVILTLE
ncbi:MAG: hypothetical protein WC243_01110 [Patescibacteria group bacterium]|jgi:hypothetical protein